MTPEERLRDAIAGERADWHRVEVDPRDIAAVLAVRIGEDIKAEVEDDVRGPWEPPVITPERFITLASDKWVQAEMMPKAGRKRTVRGHLVEVNGFLVANGDKALARTMQEQVASLTKGIRSISIEDKAGRRIIVDTPLVQRLTTGGEDGITLVIDGELAPDYRLARR